MSPPVTEAGAAPVAGYLETSLSHARSPLAFGWADWRKIALRTARATNRDNVGVIAAGVAFFSLLAIFPLVSAALSVYGFFADPVTVQEQIQSFAGVIPSQAWMIVNDQISAVINAPPKGLGLGILASLVFAFYSAGAGIRAIMRAMNVAYGEEEDRSFAAFFALAASMTVGLVLFIGIALAVIVGVPALLSVLRLGGAVEVATRVTPWVLLVSLFAGACYILYRYGPSRRPAKKRWVMAGVIFASLSWVAISLAFSIFVANFETYNATYGSLGAVIILLVWFWLTAFVVIVGAELNSEMERQTAADTTRGPERRLGLRRAKMADAVPPPHPIKQVKIGKVMKTPPE